MANLPDPLFVALARKLGKPAEADLRRVRKLQLDRRERGQNQSMFQIAYEERLLASPDAARFARWAEQIEKRDEGAIEDSDVGPHDEPAKEAPKGAETARPPEALTRSAPPPPPPPLPRLESAPPPPPALPKLEAKLEPSSPQPRNARRRVLAKSAAFFGTAVSRCAICKNELDELAIIEDRAREVEDGFACQACLDKFGTGRPAEPSKTPSGASPPAALANAPAAPASPAPAGSKTGSAGRLGTPSKRKVAAARASGEPPSPELAKQTLLVGAAVALAIALVGGAVVLATWQTKPPEPAPSPTVVALASPGARPSTAPSAAPSGPPPARRTGALATAAEATALVHEGRSREALARLDEALAQGSLETDERETLAQARTQVVSELRRKIERAIQLADEGDPAQARALARKLRDAIPPELAGALQKADVAIEAAEAASEPEPAPDASPSGPVPAATPRPRASRPPRPSPSSEPPRTGTRPSPSPEPSPDGGDDGTGPVVVRPSPRPDDDAFAPKPPAWMEDDSSSLPWDQAYVVETPHYVIRTSVAKKYVPGYEAIMEAFATRYSEVFRPPGAQGYTTKAKLVLYGSRKQFLENEPGMEGALGFYRPGSRDLHCSHGNTETDKNQAFTTLAHEAAHQFQHLANPQIFDRAPKFWTEGLAAFFESPRMLPDGKVLLGGIPTRYLRTMRRAVKANDTIPLSTLLRTPDDAFLYTEYAHAWALIHWCFYGPESKKSLKLLDWFWDRGFERKVTADDFEEGVRAMGYTMPKLEKAWRDWILSLDQSKDPAVLYYEQKTGKKIPR